MKGRTAILILTVAGAVSYYSRLPGRVPQQEPPDFVIRSDVRLVLLDVAVKDRRGGFVAGLTKITSPSWKTARRRASPFSPTRMCRSRLEF
jgi:hypothetical protein